MNPKVDWFFSKTSKWQDPYLELRRLVLECGLTEELKWGCPCYTFQQSNIVLIHGFKDYCALLFMKGALLQNEAGMLVQQTENVQAARQIRFTLTEEILAAEPTLKAYINQAIEVEKAGVHLELKKTTEFTMPEEFRRALDEMAELKAAFEALSPGRQRGYLLYFSSAKQAKTREGRVEKYIPKILHGKGLEDA